MTPSTIKIVGRIARLGVLASSGLLTTILAPPFAQAESAFGPTRGTVRRIEDPAPNSTRGDGVYGRFNGDLALQIGAGAEGDLRETTFRPLLLGSVSFYQTIGVYGTYRESFADADPWARVVSTGLVVSPLFLIRWPRAWQTGAPTLDLTVDSLALVGGVSFPEDDNAGLFGSPAAELGLEVGVPLMGRANGLFLRTRVQLTTGDDIAPATFLWLSWQGFVSAGLLPVDK